MIEHARQAKIEEERINVTSLAYYVVRCMYQPAHEDAKKVQAFAAAIDGLPERIMEILGVMPAMDDLAKAIRGLAVELMEAFSVGVDFDTAIIAAHGEDQ
ncbi:MAG: hypothetical protein EXS60_00320 [Candidatus Pacebacteria bacterium]|nr:hypothetical protein [Candidatus Paceibacterota bacterium]